jgi:hypothetical protein
MDKLPGITNAYTAAGKNLTTAGYRKHNTSAVLHVPAVA